MTALGMAIALLAAMLVGYVIGRRAAAKAPSWRQRTTRTALGRQAIGLVALATVSQLERTVQKKLGFTARRSRSSVLPGARHVRRYWQ